MTRHSTTSCCSARRRHNTACDIRRLTSRHVVYIMSHHGYRKSRYSMVLSCGAMYYNQLTHISLHHMIHMSYDIVPCRIISNQLILDHIMPCLDVVWAYTYTYLWVTRLWANYEGVANGFQGTRGAKRAASGWPRAHRLRRRRGDLQTPAASE